MQVLSVRASRRGRLSLLGCGCSTLLMLALFAQPSLPAPKNAAAPAQKPTATVPFVGCKSDGQMGPQDAPAGTSKSLPIGAKAAARLAYYQSQVGMGILAPRGWNCFGVYGSSGYALYVSPQPIVSDNLFSPDWGGFTGPAVELAGQVGGTSGRFGVARAIARVFPAHKAFADKVIHEGLEPASSFPFGPFPKDKLVYRSPEIVEYLTPANTDGLGTNSNLKKNGNPIRGVAILVGQTPDLVQLAARLPRNLSRLETVMIQQVEREATASSDTQ